jgi:dethiobiotin synthetase
MTMRGYFITGTGTGIGKTTFTCILSQALRQLGQRVVALKPIETGVHEQPADARKLADACGQPHLADDPSWYRAHAPLSPYAAHLEGESLPDLRRLADAVRRHAEVRTVVLVEGAGGLLVPLTRDTTIADLARELTLPLLLVAPNRLGVLSDVLAVHEAAMHRGLSVHAVILHQLPQDDARDPSLRTNARILEERLSLPLIHSTGIMSDSIVKLALTTAEPSP